MRRAALWNETRRLPAALVASVVLLPLVAGCPTEVPFEEPSDPPAAEGAGEEAAASDPTAAPDAPPEEQAEPLGAIDADAEEVVPEPAEPSAAVDGSASKQDGLLPWETEAQAEEPSAEAERYFSGVASDADPDDIADEEEPEAAPETSEPVAEDDSAEDSEADGFGGFLDDAYADLIDTTAEEPEPEATTEPEPEPTESVAIDPPGELGSGTKPAIPTTPPPTSIEPPRKGLTIPRTFAKRKSREPKPPTTTEPAEANDLSDLWESDTSTLPWDQPSGADAPATDSAPDALAGANDPPQPEAALPAVDTTAEADPLPFEPDLAIQREESPADELPAPWDADPIAERSPPTDRPAEPEQPEPRAERRQPLAAASIDPLPAVRVLPFNTQHLAWLLGGKLGLAELADLDGATPKEIDGWSDEVERLAKELDVSPPSSARAAAGNPADRVRRLMASAADLGQAVASEHGVDHAALVEIALKTNALLVLAPEHPELSKTVAEAVEAAADRALLPRFLWQDAVTTLSGEPTPDEALDAISELHQRVESYLR